MRNIRLPSPKVVGLKALCSRWSRAVPKREQFLRQGNQSNLVMLKLRSSNFEPANLRSKQFQPQPLSLSLVPRFRPVLSNPIQQDDSFEFQETTVCLPIHRYSTPLAVCRTTFNTGAIFSIDLRTRRQQPQRHRLPPPDVVWGPHFLVDIFSAPKVSQLAKFSTCPARNGESF